MDNFIDESIRNGDDGSSEILPSFAVANLTGGIGKTTITRTIHYMWQSAGVPLRLVSVDSVDEASSSKLASLGDEVEQMTIAPDARKIDRGDLGHAQIQHWDRIGDMLSEGGHLIDFGANAIQHLLDWAAESKPRSLLDDAPLLCVIVPVTSVAQSATDALLVLKRLYEVEPDFMKLRVVVAFNDKYGKVSEAQGPAFAALQAFVKAKGVGSFTVIKGAIQLGEEYTFLDLATVHARDFGKRVGLTPMQANTRLRFFTNWLEAVVPAAKSAGLGPEKDASAKAA